MHGEFPNRFARLMTIRADDAADRQGGVMSAAADGPSRLAQFGQTAKYAQREGAVLWMTS